MSSYTNGTTEEGATKGMSPKITLYTNHGCPWAHRAHIALKELGLPYEEVLIDLDKPREPWYLEINPRGLVPAIKYNNGLYDEIITESAIVSYFLADSRPSHLLPPSLKDPFAPLFRARVAFFVDTYFSKVVSFMWQIAKADDEEKEKLSQQALQALEKEIEPLLKDAGPFFNGHSEMTMAEVLTAPFVLRLRADSGGKFMPKSLQEGMKKLPNYSKWSDAVCQQESVTYIYDEKRVVERSIQKAASMKAQAKK
ncbi:hypothetical protein MBLNU457_4321t1 [Dothideomycetes sp. NU457]